MPVTTLNTDGESKKHRSGILNHQFSEVSDSKRILKID